MPINSAKPPVRHKRPKHLAGQCELFEGLHDHNAAEE